MSFIPNLQNKISTLNSTNVALAGGATWQGASEEVSQYGRMGVSVQTPFGTPSDGVLWIEVSHDNVNWASIPRTVSDTSTAQPHMWAIVEKYMRLKYVNGTTPTGATFSIQTQYSVNDDILLGHPLDEVPLPEHEGLLTKSVGWGTDPNGVYKPNLHDGVAFRTEVALGIGGVYTSPVTPTEGYSQIETHLFSDVEGTLVGRWYNDESKTTLIRTFTRPYTGNEVGTVSYFSSPVFGPYLEYEYTNGATGQASFFMDFHNRTQAISGQVIGLEDYLPPNIVANVGRNVTASRQPDGTYKNNPHNGVAFSTTANLGIGAVYTSPWMDTDGYNSIEVFITSDVPSAVRGIDVEFTDSLTGLAVQEEHFYTFGAEDIERGYLELEFPPKMVGFQIKYTNGATAQTNFLLQTDLKVNGDNQRYNSGGAVIIADSRVEMALGNVPNHFADSKYGTVSALDGADPSTTVWSLGDDTGVNVLSKKTFPTATGTLHMASTSASDTSKEITIVYNDANNTLQTISADLNGQTPVSLGVTALDANVAYISGADQALVGNVFISLNSSYTAGVPTTLSDSICFIKASDGRSAQATLRVPSNSKMIITNTYVAISRLNGSATSVRVDMKVKPSGGSWYVLRPYITTSSLLIDTKENIVLDEGCLIEFCIDEISDGDTNCVVIFDYEINQV
jgi:hypothetical protein